MKPLLYVGLACALVAAMPCHGRDLLLSQVYLVDPAQRATRLINLLIKDYRISEISDAARPSNVDVLNFHGKWVIPGLIDTHVHYSGNPRPDGERETFSIEQTAHRMLFCGVVAFLDLAASSPELIFGARDRQRVDPTGASNEADIYAAGVALGDWNLKSAETAPQEVARYIARWHPDVVKFIYDDARGRSLLNHASFHAALLAVQRAGVKSVVHIGTWDNARDAIDRGATVVTHLFDDAAIPASLVEAWSKSHTLSIPTMTVQTDLANFVSDPTVLDSPLLNAVAAPASIEAARTVENFSAEAKATVQWQDADRHNDVDALKKLNAAAVIVLAGSDTNNLGTFQGFSLHREIKLLQDAGMPAWDALAAATTRAAVFLGRPTGIRVGDLAELVILDADPITNIANTQRIVGVIHRGRLIDRERLRAKF